MGERVRLPFATNTYQNQSLAISAQDAVNLLAEKEPADAKTEIALISAPGLQPFLAVGAGPIRGLRVMNNFLYVVSGSSLYSVNPGTFAVVLCGTGIGGTGIVEMSDNSTQLIIMANIVSATPPSVGYVFNWQTNVFQQITSPNFFPSNTVTYFDGYFLLVKTGSFEWFFSNLFDGTTYNALDFETAIVEPSFAQAIVNQQENALIFKQRSIETWYDTGANDNPWARIDGATIERGTGSPLSVIKEDNSVFFLGDDMVFYRLNGVLLQRVSQFAIEATWRTYLNPGAAFCFSYTWNGHKFVVLTFPDVRDNATWVFDIATNLWHRRVSYDQNSASLSRWRGNCMAEWNSTVVIGDAFSNGVGELSSSVYTEFGNPMIGTAVSPPINSKRKRVFQSLLELDIQAGVGNSGAPNPQIYLDWSDDQGNTWSTPKIPQSMGQFGQYLTRVRWKKLGWFWQRYYRITISDPVARVVIAAWGDVEEGI